MVHPVRDDEQGKLQHIRGRHIEFIGFREPAPEGRQPNTSVFGKITEHID